MGTAPAGGQGSSLRRFPERGTERCVLFGGLEHLSDSFSSNVSGPPWGDSWGVGPGTTDHSSLVGDKMENQRGLV